MKFTSSVTLSLPWALLMMIGCGSNASAMIVERDVLRDSDGQWWTTRPCKKHDCRYLQPIGGDDKSKSKETRNLQEDDQQLLGPPILENPKKTFIDSKDAVDIVVKGSWQDPSKKVQFVLTKKDSPYEIRYDVTTLDSGSPFIIREDGTAQAKIKPSGGDGLYTQSLEYKNSNNEIVKVHGGSFQYGQPRGKIVRNSASNTVVDEAAYEGGGVVTEAVGRIYYSSLGEDYSCSGTAVRDNQSGRSLVFTAAHCVWDDFDGNFGSDVIFIPNRDAVSGDTLVNENTTLADIHRQCDDDICGCWRLSGGVVHDKWPDTPWPDRLVYDYGFYVVDDVGHHEGASCGSDALDMAVDVLDFHVGVPLENEFAYSFGYSLEYNPDFRYCAETVAVAEPTAGVYTAWMDSCFLSGGSSGGPWITNFDAETGLGQVVSVNSWSFEDTSGNGGPFIEESAARCLINTARHADMEYMMSQPIGEQGIYAQCHDRPCILEEGVRRRKLRGNRHRQLCEGETMIVPKKMESKP